MNTIDQTLQLYDYSENGKKYQYFIGSEVGLLLGFKKPTNQLKKISDENKILFKDYKGNKDRKIDPRQYLINKDGVYEILKSKKCKKLSQDVIDILKIYDIEIQQKEDDDVVDEEEKDKLTTYFYISNGIYFEYFVGYEILALIGYKNITANITNIVSKQHQLVFKDYPGVKKPQLDQKSILITREGVSEILIRTRKRITDDVLLLFKEFGIETTNKKVLTKEQQTLSALANAFKTENIEDQYSIGTYYLDMYFSEYKIVVECDENGHSDRKPCDERERMDFVNNELGIDDSNWIRFNPDEYDFDISKVINRIYRKINDIKEESEKKANRNQLRVSDISNMFEKENPVSEYDVDNQYQLDLYFPKQKIIFEFDKNDRTRMNYINTYLGIDDTHWILFNPDDETFDISKVIGKLYILMKEKEVYMKMCSTCRKERPSTEYHNSKNSSDGLSFRCRSCRIEISNKPIQKIETPECKYCPQCENEKLSTEFWKNPDRKDGLDIVCSSCRKENEKKIIDGPKIVKETKTCSKCKELKNTLTDFYKRKKSFDGYSGVCSVCEKENRKKRKENMIHEPPKEFKKCFTCNETKKTATSFFKSKKSIDGYSGVCKDCNKNSEWFIKLSEKKKKEKEEKEEEKNKRKIAEFKVCFKCKVSKKTNIDFHKRKDTVDGYRGVCKTCINESKKKKDENVEIIFETKL